MKAFLLGPRNESAQRLRMLLKKSDFDPKKLRIGIDGGVDDWLALGYPPSMAIGDWDSLSSKQALKGLAQVTLPRKKDRSDLHFALRLARSMGADEITVFGVTGGRPDHHLASLLDLAEAAAERGVLRLTARDETANYHFISPKMGRFRLPTARGAEFSLFSPLGTARGVSLEGARYPLKNAKLAPGSLGLSNVAASGPLVISVKSGVLLAIRPADESGW